MNSLVAVVTLLAVLTYLWTGMGVARARRACGINAPAMTGDPRLERAVRVQMNTLEWMPIFLPSLWVFAAFFPVKDWAAPVSAGLGLVWIAGRVIYARAYVADPSTRTTGFMIQALASAVLLFGGLICALLRMAGVTAA